MVRDSPIASRPARTTWPGSSPARSRGYAGLTGGAVRIEQDVDRAALGTHRSWPALAEAFDDVREIAQPTSEGVKYVVGNLAQRSPTSKARGAIHAVSQATGNLADLEGIDRR
jgi:hypothetical protein